MSTQYATVKDLIAANKLVKFVKSTQTEILFPKFNSLKKVYLKVYTDASFKNLVNGNSQGGHIVFLTDGYNSCPLVWKSAKIKRVVKSTVAAETLALADGCETAFMLSKLVSEVITGKKDSSLPVVAVTDNHSLFVAAQSTSKLEDSRLQIDMNIIRQMIEREEMSLQWVKSEDQLGDILTKSGASGAKLREVISQGHF